MSYQQQGPPYGYQQPAYPAQQWQGAPVRAGNPVTAIVATVFGLGAAACLIVVALKNLSHLNELNNIGPVDLGSGFADFKSQLTIVIAVYFGAAFVLLLGGVIVLLRKVPGAVLLLLGGLLGIFAITIEPAIVQVYDNFGTYMTAVFKFGDAEASFRAVGLIASVLALLFAILPPTFTWLRGSRSAPAYGYPQQAPPARGW